jgi:hypothetical protein
MNLQNMQLVINDDLIDEFILGTIISENLIILFVILERFTYIHFRKLWEMWENCGRIVGDCKKCII